MSLMTTWQQQNGGIGLWVGGCWRYPSGARKDSSGTHTQPSSDTRQRLRDQADYYKAKLRQTESHIHALDSSLRGFTFLPFEWPEKVYGPGPKNGNEALAYLKSIAQSEREKLSEIESELEAIFRSGVR